MSGFLAIQEGHAVLGAWPVRGSRLSYSCSRRAAESGLARRIHRVRAEALGGTASDVGDASRAGAGAIRDRFGVTVLPSRPVVVAESTVPTGFSWTPALGNEPGSTPRPSPYRSWSRRSARTSPGAPSCPAPQWGDSRRGGRSSGLRGDRRRSDDGPGCLVRIPVIVTIQALSRGINDPTAAVPAFGRIHHLLLGFGRRQLDDGRARTLKTRPTGRFSIGPPARVGDEDRPADVGEAARG